MSREAIVERILSDANAEADAIRREAEEKAAGVIAAASARAEQGRREAEAEVKVRAEDVMKRRAAAARLDSAKLLLAEKRRVLDGVYEAAFARLKGLDEEDALALAGRLLEEYAEEGDEILFAADYPYVAFVARLPVVAEKKLTLSPERAEIGGGFVLRGKTSDKDLSYGALLAADREEHQAEIAAELFKDNG